MPNIDQLVADLALEVEELKRRDANKVRPMKVKSLDAKKGLVTLEDGDLVTPPLPWIERAGSIKTWSPPSIGEQVLLLSPSGEIGQGWVLPGGFSKSNKQPHNKGAEHVITIGDTRIEVKGDETIVTCPKVVVKSSDISLGGEGGPKVARIGDMVHVTFGSSAGLHPICEGSDHVTATG